MNNAISTWLAELFKRFSLESPKFFQVWQVIGLLATGAGFLPDILTELKITPGPFMSHTLSIVLKVAGIIVWIQAKLPVTNPEQPVKSGEVVDPEKALPFTAPRTEVEAPTLPPKKAAAPRKRTATKKKTTK